MKMKYSDGVLTEVKKKDNCEGEGQVGMWLRFFDGVRGCSETGP